jgi:hypothetical protein
VTADAAQWKAKALPLPEQREALGLSLRLSSAEAAKLADGFIPQEMEDKWFVYYEEPWLFFQRSWTGHRIYQLRFAPDAGDLVVVESWVNRKPNEYGWTDTEFDRRYVVFLIDTLLLGRPATMPELPIKLPEELRRIGWKP